MDPAVLRAQDVVRSKEEKERIKREATRIRVTVLACKHLPKMDTFGKTDAYCVVTIDNKAAGGQKMKRKTKVVKNSLDPVFIDQSFVFNVFDFPTQVQHTLRALLKCFCAVCGAVICSCLSCPGTGFMREGRQFRPIQHT